MAWINSIGESEAEGALKRIRDEQRLQDGAGANILNIHSLAADLTVNISSIGEEDVAHLRDVGFSDRAI